MAGFKKATPYTVDEAGRLVWQHDAAIDIEGKHAGQIAEAIKQLGEDTRPPWCATEETFAAALPEGWTVEITQLGRGYLVTARHTLYGRASIGPKLRLVQTDVEGLRKAVEDVEAPPLTYSQWLRAGRRQGYLTIADDEPLPRMLRLLAICIEREDVEASDVVQALLRRDTYTLDCPISEASHFGADVAELYALLMRVAEQYGIELQTQGSDADG